MRSGHLSLAPRKESTRLMSVSGDGVGRTGRTSSSHAQVAARRRHRTSNGVVNGAESKFSRRLTEASPDELLLSVCVCVLLFKAALTHSECAASECFPSDDLSIKKKNYGRKAIQDMSTYVRYVTSSESANSILIPLAYARVQFSRPQINAEMCVSMQHTPNSLSLLTGI